VTSSRIAANSRGFAVSILLSSIMVEARRFGLPAVAVTI
jgi:hypothetical protein